jgi:hypothetical protein
MTAGAEPPSGPPEELVSPPADPPLLDQFLAATDLDELASVYDTWRRATGPQPDVEATIAAQLTSWSQSQGLANLLMYPLVIAPEWRLAALERALGDADNSYLRLAAIVGLDHLDPAELPDQIRHRLAQQLLDLIASVAGVAAERASVTVSGLLRTTDAPELVEVVLHPSPLVRQNLTQALFTLTGTSGVRALLEEPGFVEPDVQHKVHEQLTADGIDLALPAEDQHRPIILSYLPNLAEWAD